MSFLMTMRTTHIPWIISNGCKLVPSLIVFSMSCYYMYIFKTIGFMPIHTYICIYIYWMYLLGNHKIKSKASNGIEINICTLVDVQGINCIHAHANIFVHTMIQCTFYIMLKAWECKSARDNCMENTCSAQFYTF